MAIEASPDGGMQVICTGARELPLDWDETTAGSLWEPYTTVAGTKVTTTPTGSACGKTITVSPPHDGDPGLLTTWDVKTDSDGNVIERHADVLCECGTLTFIVKGD